MKDNNNINDDNITNLIVSILLMKSEGFSHNVKFFLIRVLIVYGYQIPVHASIKELIVRLAVSNRDIKNARDRLIREGILISDRVMPKGETRSRLIEGFKFDEVRLKGFIINDNSQNLVPEIKERVLELFYFQGASKDNNKTENETADVGRGFCSQGSHHLRSSNRVLLGMLLLHSSRFGVVEGLGLGTIGKLAGMPPDKVKSQIKTLMKKGYIRRYIPGGTSKKIFGVFPGVYFLDINHEDYNAKKLSLTHCLFGLKGASDYPASEALELSNKAHTYSIKSKAMKLQIQVGPVISYGFIMEITDEYLSVLPFFKDVAFRKYFQFYIDNLASILLSKRFMEIEEFQVAQRIKPLQMSELKRFMYDDLDTFEKVVWDITIPRPEATDIKEKEIEKARQEEIKRVAELIYMVAFEKARLFKFVMYRFCSALPLKDMSFQILSTQKFVTVFCLSRTDINWDWSYIGIDQEIKTNLNLLTDNSQNLKPDIENTKTNYVPVSFLKSKSATHIDKEILYEFGLLTRVE